jgi:hypothetical protein
MGKRAVRDRANASLVHKAVYCSTTCYFRPLLHTMLLIEAYPLAGSDSPVTAANLGLFVSRYIVSKGWFIALPRTKPAIVVSTTVPAVRVPAKAQLRTREQQSSK